MVLVSACLYGIDCRYDGRSKTNSGLIASLRKSCIVPFCPEQLGGLPTPRYRCWITQGEGIDVLKGRAMVTNEIDEDVTMQFVKGTAETEKIVSRFNIKKAYLKNKSPSCGVGKIYRENRLAEGNGVCAAMLKERGLELISV